MGYTKLICGKLYDGIHNTLQKDMEILIEGKRIKEAGAALPCPEGTKIVDLSNLTVTPGMIDAHVHPQYFSWRNIYTDMIFNSSGYRALATYRCA